MPPPPGIGGIFPFSFFCTTTHSVVRSSPAMDAAFCRDRKSTRLNSSHSQISYAVFCLKKQPLGIGSQATVKSTRPVGKAHTKHIHCMDSGVACQSRDCVAPREGITPQSVQQPQRRHHADAQTAPARAVQGNPMIFEGV